uniref:Uncharacterized protein n=1 Tax=Arundo donax TaxID=35708 RepID=A0A0A9FTF1_ARUDO
MCSAGVSCVKFIVESFCFVSWYNFIICPRQCVFQIDRLALFSIFLGQCDMNALKIKRPRFHFSKQKIK